MSMQFGKAAHRRLTLAEVPRESDSADRLLDNSRQMIRLDLIDDSPRNPRSTINDTALQELADSIAEHGLLQAPVVRRHPDRPGRYLTVLGARRIAAHQHIGREEIEVIIRRLDDQRAFLASCVENVQRVQLSPREELDIIGVLIDELGSQDAAARALGKSKSWISKRKRLLQAPALAAAVERGEISLDHAYDLLTRSHDDSEVQQHLQRVRAGTQNQDDTRDAVSRRRLRRAPHQIATGAASSTALSGFPKPDPRASLVSVSDARPLMFSAPTLSEPDARETGSLLPGQHQMSTSPVSTGTAPVSGRNFTPPDSVLRASVDEGGADQHDMVLLETLETLRLARRSGSQASRRAVLDALRADVAALTQGV